MNPDRSSQVSTSACDRLCTISVCAHVGLRLYRSVPMLVCTYIGLRLYRSATMYRVGLPSTDRAWGMYRRMHTGTVGVLGSPCPSRGDGYTDPCR